MRRAFVGPAVSLLAFGVVLGGALAVDASSDAAPSALVGRFKADDGSVLRISSDEGGGFVLVLGDDSGAARLDDGALRGRWDGDGDRSPRDTPGLAGALREGSETDAPEADAPAEGEGYPPERVPPPSAAPAGPITAPLEAPEGRLAVRLGGRLFVREDGAPWWRLPSGTRADLTAPFQVIELRPERREPFDAWFEERYAGTPVSERDALAEWGFGRLGSDERTSLLCVHAKMKSDEVWSVVGPIQWVGDGGVLLFEPSMPDALLQRFLSDEGFGDWWAASRDSPWGMRSRFRGVQLHFRGGPIVNVHIDFVNPGDPPGGGTTSWLEELALGAEHFIVDLQNWSENHTTDRVLREVRDSGIEVFVP